MVNRKDHYKKMQSRKEQNKKEQNEKEQAKKIGELMKKLEETYERGKKEVEKIREQERIEKQKRLQEALDNMTIEELKELNKKLDKIKKIK